jgi:hypothetical protein
VAYADAKISYYTELRVAMPELTNIAMGREPRPQEVDRFRDAFQPAGEIREIAADNETVALIERFSGDPEVQKAVRNSTMLRNLKRLSSKISRGKTLPDATLQCLLEEFKSRSFSRWRSAAARWLI